MDVINGVREAFLDEGMDEQVLLELKQVVTITISVFHIFIYKHDNVRMMKYRKYSEIILILNYTNIAISTVFCRNL